MFDLMVLPDDGLVDAIVAWDRDVSWAQAGQLAAIAELARRRPAEPGQPSDGSGVSEFAVDEVAAALRLSRPAAGARLHVAVEVARRLPATGAALRRGEVDFAKARAVVEAVMPLDDATAAAVEARVLPRAGGQTVGQLRASLARAVLAADPAAAEVRHAGAVTDRRVALTPLTDGMAELWALLPADAATAIYSALDTEARRGPADDRGMDARRADALTHLITGTATATGTVAGGRRPGTGPLVHVTVAASTLLGLDNEPGDLAGYGAGADRCCSPAGPGGCAPGVGRRHWHGPVRWARATGLDVRCVRWRARDDGGPWPAVAGYRGGQRVGGIWLRPWAAPLRWLLSQTTFGLPGQSVWLLMSNAQPGLTYGATEPVLPSKTLPQPYPGYTVRALYPLAYAAVPVLPAIT
jgi:hypothetical protein